MPEKSETTVLYSASFIFVCPNCHREQHQTAGRKDLVYTCRWCDKTYQIKIFIQVSDSENNLFGD